MNLRVGFRNFLLLVAMLAPPATQAQAPVEERGRAALQQGQQRTGLTYRDLEQARYDARLAEQDMLNARDAHTAAQQQATLRQRELDAAQKALAAARARVAAAQQAYDKAVSDVDAAHRAAKQVPLGGAAPVTPAR
jgi:hypothetical protein